MIYNYCLIQGFNQTLFFVCYISPSHSKNLVTHYTVYTPFTLALLIRSETGFAPMRAVTLHQLIRIRDLDRIKLNHLKEEVSHRFSLLRVIIASVDATRTRTKAEQIWPNQRQMLHSYLRCLVPGVFPFWRKCSVVNTILLSVPGCDSVVDACQA